MNHYQGVRVLVYCYLYIKIIASECNVQTQRIQ